MSDSFNRADHCRTIGTYGGMQKSEKKATSSARNAAIARAKRLEKLWQKKQGQR